jgi:pseudouridine synthase
MMGEERLQKYLAHAGVGSRRTCEDFIRQGRVMVNGQVSPLGTKVTPGIDRITFDGREITIQSIFIYIMLNKPPGVISSLKVRGKEKGLLDLVEVKDRIYPVGRLDKLSEGLILLTNDGNATNKLTHPRYEHEREYRVQVKGTISQRDLEHWRRGTLLDEGIRTAPAKVWLVSTSKETSWLGVVMREGRKRQIRRVAGGFSLEVLRLIRIRMGSLELGDLASGSWRHLNEKEILELKESIRKFKKEV